MKKWTFVFLLSLITLATLVLPVAAKTTRTEYAGVSYCGPVTDAQEWVSEGGVLHARDGNLVCDTVVDDDRISGKEQLTVNYNFKFTDPPVFIYGSMWGKIRLSNEDGYWEGIWVGQRTELDGFSYIRVVLHGYEAYEGLQARVDYIRENPDPEAPYQVYGVIMEAGGK